MTLTSYSKNGITYDIKSDKPGGPYHIDDVYIKRNGEGKYKVYVTTTTTSYQYRIRIPDGDKIKLETVPKFILESVARR